MPKDGGQSIFVVPEGMPRGIFEDRYSRPHSTENRLQKYHERVIEMVMGNVKIALKRGFPVPSYEIDEAIELAVKGVTPMSGRHIQQGDLDQPNRSMEVFTNCSTTPFSFMVFLLLLNGSGVGRDYSSESCRVDWDYMPNFRLVLDGGDGDLGDVEKGAHPDFNKVRNEFDSIFESKREAVHKYDSESEDVRWIKVRDSREGWGEVLAILETAAFHRNHSNALFIFDFSDVRGEGSPIKGMQNKKAQGPIPMMRALAKVSTIKGAGMKPWKQAIFIDHYMASCVVMGNVRRAARMATKSAKDRDVIEFIDLKRGGFLWSSNNSILVDEEFWSKARDPRPSHERRVFEAAIGAAYFDQTGEPGFINVDKLENNREGLENINADNYIGDVDLRLHPKTYEMIDKVLRVLKESKYLFITNPCGEIVLAKHGAYCVIGDVIPFYADSKEECLSAVRHTAKFLIRVNLLRSTYQAEVARTNRIGVGLTGIFEFAWKFFKYGFYDLIDEEVSGDFWEFIKEMRDAVIKEAAIYSKEMNLVVPHTFTTIKPSGTISKVMNVTEGAHLPAYDYYIRWVIFPKGSEKHKHYESLGYPIKDVSHKYQGSIVVGFPTKMAITDIIPADKLVLAGQATPQEQYQWVRLLEKYWLGDRGNQVSYTLKYDPKKVDFQQFMEVILQNQPTVKCCSVMPQEDESAHAYLPEERIFKDEYDTIMGSIVRDTVEDYDEDSLSCEGGVCPIEERIN